MEYFEKKYFFLMAFSIYLSFSYQAFLCLSIVPSLLTRIAGGISGLCLRVGRRQIFFLDLMSCVMSPPRRIWTLKLLKNYWPTATTSSHQLLVPRAFSCVSKLFAT